MCGIFGIVDFDKAPVDKASLKRISEILTRRGPDEEGFFIEEREQVNIAFVHRRLSIIGTIGILTNATNSETVLSKTKAILETSRVHSLWIGSSLDGIGQMYDKIRGMPLW